MKKIILLFLILLFITSQAICQGEGRVTTFIVVRHAEKSTDGTKDPELTAAGSDRANKLVQMLKDVSVSAIFSTDFKRTKNTVMPLATTKGIEVQLYETFKSKETEDVLKKYAGGTIVICGHSNTVPSIVNQLIGKDEFKNLEDSDYGSLFIVSIVEKGKPAGVTRLQY
jgi:2,3-bisphosphoglycerate-dependent phosphoglycerate mutase